MQKKDSVIYEVANIENLILAWRKVEQSFHHGNVWFDEIEISKFKFLLIDNVRRIRQELLDGTYNLKPLLPAPFPKGNDVEGNLQVRQSFLVSVEDQVVWMAVVNVIGPVFEREMPAWSYGNRLNNKVWKENKTWKIGDVMKSSTRIYRPWNRSWPLYRKQLAASLKCMAFANLKDIPALTEEEQQIADENNSIQRKNSYLKLPYLEKNYFDIKAEKEKGRLYWAGIDLEKFYQYANMKEIGGIICDYYSDDEDFCSLIEVISDFKIDTLNYSQKELEKIQLDKPFLGLPTGLAVAGFLANVFLLDVDKEIKDKLERNRNVIHFRYVDDHVFVSTSPIELYRWINEYNELIRKKGVKINFDKLEPKEFSKDIFLQELSDKEIEEKMEKASLDPFYPSPLMTETLQKVSELSGLNLDLLSDKEFDMVFKDLQMLMVADIPEQEIKKNTRVSFACSMLTRMVADWDCDLEKVYELRKQWIDRVKVYEKNLSDKERKEQIQKIDSMYQLAFSNGTIDRFDELITQIKGLPLDLTPITVLKDVLNNGSIKSNSKKEKIYRLLTKAIMEIPDKSKIWLRAFDYCTYNIPEKIIDLYKLLRHIENEKKLHPLGCEYLYAMLHLRMAHNLVKAISRLLEDHYITPTQKRNDRSFIESVLKIKPKESGHYLVIDSLAILNTTKLLYKAFAKNIKLPKIEIKGDFGDDVVYRDESLPFNFWMLWGLDIINSKVPTSDMKIKTVFGQYINKICPEKAFFLPLICRCLMDFKEADYGEIHFANPPYSLPDEFNSFEFFYVISKLPEAKSFGENFEGYETFKKQTKPDDFSKNTTISVWLDFVNEEFLKDEDFRLDVRSSELLASKIALAIGEAANKKLSSGKRVIIHPLSVTISTIQRDKKVSEYGSWHYWRVNSIHAEIKDKTYIDDTCYCYTDKVLGNVLRSEEALLYAIGLLFLQLLTKQKVLPWIFYRPEFGFEWDSVLLRILYDGAISTKNYLIVRSCLSAYNREIFKMLHNNTGENDIPPLYGVKCLGLQDLIKELRDSVSILEDNLVSVANEESRQLTEISLY